MLRPISVIYHLYCLFCSFIASNAPVDILGNNFCTKRIPGNYNNFLYSDLYKRTLAFSDILLDYDWSD